MRGSCIERLVLVYDESVLASPPDVGPHRGKLIVMPTSMGPDEVAHWLSEQKGEPVHFEKVEPGDEQVLEDPEQRELDGVASPLDAEGVDE